MSFIDASYFIGELTIPNSDSLSVAERITWFINKYEPEFLRKLMGYPLYKAFVAGMNVVLPATPAQRFLDILYGKEYTDFQGYVQKWNGLVVTDSPVFNLSGGLAYKKPVYLTAGITPGFIAGINTVTFNGSVPTDDWRGWTPIITRAGIMKPEIDYSFNTVTGEVTLLRTGDKFNNNEDFFVQFELRTDGAVPVIDLSANRSLIANYVYYWYRRSNATQYAGIGEVMTKAENSDNANPRRKIASAWNEMNTWVEEFCAFMQATQDATPLVYPEWTQVNKYDALKEFGFMNPIF
jgi:hypothetical protein